MKLNLMDQDVALVCAGLEVSKQNATAQGLASGLAYAARCEDLLRRIRAGQWPTIGAGQ